MATIIVGTNSWITLAEADAYLDNKFEADNWTAAVQNYREQAIITSFWRIYGSSEYTISKASTDENVKNAQAETAYFILTYNSELSKRSALQATGVKSHSISKFSELYSGKVGTLLPQEAIDLLDAFQSFNPVGIISRDLD